MRSLWPSVTQAFVAAFELEIRHGRLELWAGFGLSLGVLWYFSLAQDLPFILLMFLLSFGFMAVAAMRYWRWLDLLSPVLAALLLGIAASFLSVWLAQSPRILQPMVKTLVTGHVLQTEYRVDRPARIVLAVVDIEGMQQEAQPKKLQLVGKNLARVQVGDQVRLQARLRPPMQPTHIGGYNMAFHAYFDRIGGSGLVSGTIETVALAPPSFFNQMNIQIARWRMDMTQRLRTHLSGANGAIAASLITGERAAIPESMLVDFNASGLMHVLSISGLHMMLVAGGAYWLFRAFLALFSPIALRFPIKKWAAVLALIIASYYEVLSGAAIATTRSYVMCMIAFIAILVDRPAISMRNLVLAWILILLIAPQQLFTISFQMSFAATAFLIAAYERQLFPDWQKIGQPLPVRLFMWTSTLIAVALISSVVAEIAVLPFSLHHFHKVSWYGMAGNLLAHLAIEAIIMPATLVMLLALPLGLEALVAPFLGFGVDRMVDVAQFVGSWPGAVTRFGGFGVLSMGVMAFAIVWACLWRSWLAFLALIPYLVGLGFGAFAQDPDIRISANGFLIGVLAQDSRLALLGERSETFLKSRWLEVMGDTRTAQEAGLNPQAMCDASGCVVRAKTGQLVAIARHPAALIEDCQRADVIVTRLSAPIECPAARLVIDRQKINDGQGIEIYLPVTPSSSGIASFFQRQTPLVQTSLDACGGRPWCPDEKAQQIMRRPREKRSAPEKQNSDAENNQSGDALARTAAPTLPPDAAGQQHNGNTPSHSVDTEESDTPASDE